MYLGGRKLGNFKPPKSKRLEAKRQKPAKKRAARPGNSEDHLAALRRCPCVITLKMPAGEVHHLKYGTNERGAGMRSSARLRAGHDVRAHQDDKERKSEMTKTPKPKLKICRSFRQDFPEFVARAEALDVSIHLQKGRRDGWDRVYWLDGYRQLTGYTSNSDGSRFRHSDAVKNIDRILSKIEADRQVMASLSVPERFERVMVEMRKIVPQFGMIGEAKLPCGDDGYCFFACELVSDFQGSVRLVGIGEVAKAEAEFRYGETGHQQMARFCASLEADFAARSSTLKDTEAA